MPDFDSRWDEGREEEVDSQLIDDAKRLTTPRAFEPNYKDHLKKLAEDAEAELRLIKAGYDTHAKMLKLARSI